MNRYWDVVSGNEAAQAFFTFLLGDADPGAPARNVVRLMFRPDGLRPYVTNWDSVAEGLIQRVHREAVGGVADERTKQLLSEVLSYPGVPERWRALDPALPLSPLVPIAFSKSGFSFRYFSTVTTLGTPQDITLQELRVECFFPIDLETAQQALRFRSGYAHERGARSSEAPISAGATR
jgi:hypothetical protein